MYDELYFSEFEVFLSRSSFAEIELKKSVHESSRLHCISNIDIKVSIVSCDSSFVQIKFINEKTLSTGAVVPGKHIVNSTIFSRYSEPIPLSLNIWKISIQRKSEICFSHSSNLFSVINLLRKLN